MFAGLPFEKMVDRIESINPILVSGKVRQVVGLLIESTGPSAAIGDVCEIHIDRNNRVLAEVVGFQSDCLKLMPYEKVTGIKPGCRVVNTGKSLRIPVSRGMVGRIVDGRALPIDGKGEITPEAFYSVSRTPPTPFERRRIRQQLTLGIRSLDGLLSVGRGQRVGIFAGSGVGKSTLIGMMARYTDAPIIVVGLIGERGREVREFIERDLGTEGLKRSVIVVSTSDQSALLRVKAAYTTTAIAEFFRDQGHDVLLMMDSVTRFAMSLREIGLNVGEPATTRAYPPSVFAILPQLLERTGSAARGTITAFYTVLVEGDDMDEPVADTVRGILDGHVVLSRKLAQENHLPAVDILQSVSRLFSEVSTPEHQELHDKFIESYSVYKSNEDLIKIGAYARGSDPRIDKSLALIEKLNLFLRQKVSEHSKLKETVQMLRTILKEG